MAKKTKTKPPARRRPARNQQLPSEVRASLATIRCYGEADINAAEGDEKRVPSFKTTVYTGGLMRPVLSGIGWFGYGVVLDLAGWKFQPGQSACNWQHDRHDPVGHITAHTIDTQVKCEGLLSIPGESTDKIVEGAGNGVIWRTSVEGNPDFEGAERILEGESVVVNGKRFKGPILVLRSGVFTGFGFVTTSADPNVKTTIAATDLSHPTDLDSEMDFETFLEAQGVDADTASDTLLATLQASFDAQYGEPEEDDDEAAPKIKGGKGKTPFVPKRPKTPRRESTLTAAEIIAEENRCRAENSRRCSEISRLCAKAGHPTIKVGKNEVDLESHAIESGMDARDVKLAIYESSAPQGPAIHSHSAADNTTVEAMAAAVLLASDIPVDSEHFQHQAARNLGVPKALRASINDDARQQALDAAHAYGDVNMLQLAADCLRAEGKPVPRDRESLIQAAASSGRLTQVYQATVGASTLLGYREKAGTLERWTGVDTVPDFKEVQRFREDIAETLDYLPPDGEAEHSTVGAEYEVLAADSYAKQLVIGRHHYINNNLGILAKRPRAMGLAAYRVEENLGYAMLLKNPTMRSTGRPLFNATDGTLKTGMPLNRANAEALIAAMMSQTGKVGDDRVTLDLEARYFLLPPVLKHLAQRLFQSKYTNEDGGDGELNALYDDGIVPIATNRIAVGTRNPKTKEFEAGSSTDYYVVAEGIEVAARVYLAGSNRAPLVRVEQLKEGKWGTSIDIIHDFGFGFLATNGIFLCEA